MKLERLKALVDMFPTQEEAARVAGVSTVQLRRYLAGSPIKFDAVARLAQHQGVSLDWLAGTSSARKPGTAQELSEEEMWEVLRSTTAKINEIQAEYGHVPPVWTTTIQELMVRFNLPAEGARRIFQSIKAEQKKDETDN